MGPRVFCVLLILTGITLEARAGTGRVVLTDGTVLEGSVTRLEAGDVRFRTGDEEYRIPRKLVRSLSGAAPVTPPAPADPTPLSGDAGDLLDAAVARLSSSDAGVRESAVRCLRALGPGARTRLEAAARRPDLPETSREALRSLLGERAEMPAPDSPLNIFRLLREPEAAERVLAKRLALSDPQRKKVRALLRESAGKLRDAVTPPGRESVEKVRAVVVGFRESLAALVTDVQLRRFDGKNYRGIRIPPHFGPGPKSPLHKP